MSGVTTNYIDKACVWRRDDEGIYHTDCKHEWMFTDGDTAADIGAKFCIYCGGNINEVIPMKITVNGAEHQVEKTSLHYDDVVRMEGYDPKRVLSVVYHGPRSGDSRRSGTMHPGCNPVTIEEGMRFTVADTSSA